MRCVGNKVCRFIRYLKKGVFFAGIGIMTIVSSVFPGRDAAAASMPSPDAVYGEYRNNPYIRFYSGSNGTAWTTIRPGECSVSEYGSYVYDDPHHFFRGAGGTEVIPEGVITRKELQGELLPGQHYYASAITDSVIPVGKWVLEHPDARCVHGPFSAGRDYEYYGFDSLVNQKCGEPYDSGWVAYCADCGEEITGYVYTNDTCVRNIRYIFTGTGEFATHYPVEYLFICPVRGDNLENDISLQRHMCKSFVSWNRYNIVYDGNGAESGYMDPSVCFFGGNRIYEGREVTGETTLKANAFLRPGYMFAGWSDSPTGQKIFNDGASCGSLENFFPFLRAKGDGSDNRTVTLYAVWKKIDSVFKISAGSLGSSRGSYNGIYEGTFTSGCNSFERGYGDTTEVSISLLVPPHGFRVDFDPMGGTAVASRYAGAELSGWTFESTDPAARNMASVPSGMFTAGGRISGSVPEIRSDGGFTYVHTSGKNKNTDTARAVWKSTYVVLPSAYRPGYVFKGWYTKPGSDPLCYAGAEGDLFRPGADTVLYAYYSAMELSASPDYAGSADFGENRYKGISDLSVSGSAGCDIYKYFISDVRYPYDFREAVTETASSVTAGGRVIWSVPGEYNEYKIPFGGIYTFELWGAGGSSYGEYEGESGEYSSCGLYLEKGDVVGIYTGRPGATRTEGGDIRCGGGEWSYVTVNGVTVMSASGGRGAEYSLNVSRTFECTGSIRTYTAEGEGDYRLQVWGARGGYTTRGGSAAGNGGYAEGTVHLPKGSILYICAGGTDGYNGGGSGGRDAYGERGGPGGGATHIASKDGLLSSLSSDRSCVYIVAGGGGGSGGSGSIPGIGGGLSGSSGISPWPGGENTATGGTQTAAGSGGLYTAGGFGYGGTGYSYEDDNIDSAMINNGGGGGGWFGGGGGGSNRGSYGAGGGGGSGYIGGVTDGRMENGICDGNGYAVITCRVEIDGEPAKGDGTVFYPGDIPYCGHVVKAHEDTFYPEGDASENGYCVMTIPDERFYSASDISVYSPDLASPDPVENIGFTYDPVTGRSIITWSMPHDNGSRYSFMAKGYRIGDIYRVGDVFSGTDVSCDTDVKELNIMTGIYRYFYLIDETPERSAAYVLSNGRAMNTAWTPISGSSKSAEFAAWYEGASEDEKKSAGVYFTPEGRDRYIHVIAADRAGNISTVKNMAVDGRNANIPYPLVTESMTVLPGEGVCRDGSSPSRFFIRSDGETVFKMVYAAHINGPARPGYQIDRASVCRSGSERAEFVFSHGNVLREREDAELYGINVTSSFDLIPRATGECFREDHCSRLTFVQNFVSSHSGESFYYPQAEAGLDAGGYSSPGGGRITSDHVCDILNGVTLIGDPDPPLCYISVNGGEWGRLEGCDISNIVSGYVIDRRLEDVSICLKAADECSGLKDGFDILVRNNDSGLEGTYRSTGDTFVMDLKPDAQSMEPSFENRLFNGDFSITVTAFDKVGNKAEETSGAVLELDVSGRIERCLDEVSGPLTDAYGNRYMKRGESGRVLSFVWGYPDAVFVSFDDDTFKDSDTLYVMGDIPDELAGFSGNTVRAEAGYLLEERTGFTVPLDYEGDKISARITAYRGDECVTWHAECAIGSGGSVLDELATVLR